MSEQRDQTAEQLLELSISYGHEVFDPGVNLCLLRPGAGVHMTRESLLYALGLLEQGGREREERAGQIVDAVLSTQELNSNSPRYGAFKWHWEDSDTGNWEPNTPKFVCPPLIHMLLAYPEKLGNGRCEAIRKTLRAASGPPLRAGFNVDYTNIALLAAFSLIVGGEILAGDVSQQNDGEGKRIMRRGTELLNQIISQTNEMGAPTEFNSPTYSAVSLVALAWLARFAGSREIRLKARLVAERIWLQLAAHFHPPTRRIGGPYSRAYQNDVTGRVSIMCLLLFRELGEEFSPDLDSFRQYDMSHNILWGIAVALLDLQLPDYIRALFLKKQFPYLTRETTDKVANQVEAGDITTYQTAQYSLGTAGRSYHYPEQANNFLLHWKGDEGVRAMYSRLRVNDQIYGTALHELNRSNLSNDNERGVFRSVHQDNRVLALYVPHTRLEAESLRVDLTVPDSLGFEALWINERPVRELPATAKLTDTVFIKDGHTQIAIRPLPCLIPGSSRGIEIRQVDKYLYFSIYCYAGPARSFEPEDVLCGFVVEVNDLREDEDFDVFRKKIAEGEITCRLTGDRIYDAEYRRGKMSLRIRCDLNDGRIVERRTNGTFFVPPMFSSPTAQQNRSGRIELADAVLLTQNVSALLLADSPHRCYVAVNPELRATPLKLETPFGVLETEAFPLGKIVWQVGKRAELRVESVYLPEPIIFSKPEIPCRVWVNGRDATEEVQERGENLVVPAETGVAAGTRG